MWLWLQRELLKKRPLWVRLAGLSLLLHLCLLAGLFLSGKSSQCRSLDVSKVYDAHTRVVVLPFHKVAPAELNKKRVGGIGSGTKSAQLKTSAKTVYPATRLVHLGPSLAQQRAAARKRQAEKRRQEKLRAERKAKALKKKQAQKRLLEEKRRKAQEAARKKAELEKKRAADKKAALEQASLEQAALEKAKLEKAKAARDKEKLKKAALEQASLEQEKKAKIEQSRIEQARIEQEKRAREKVAAQEVENSIGTGSALGGSGGDGDSGEENILYVGRDELAEYQENTELYEALLAVWHPPLGIEPDKSCALSVVINKNGRAERVKVEASSGVLVYDSAAQAALYAMHFPERHYGATLQIVFR